jgi:16S rRNA (guanine1516-N2)-methyltransferase
MPSCPPLIVEDRSRIEEARRIAARFRLPLVETNAKSHSFILVLTGRRLELRTPPADGYGPIFVEFATGAAGYRHRHGGGRSQAIARAVGLRRGKTPRTLDATAGLGRDAFALACLGCPVTLVERSAPIAALLADALERAQRSLEVSSIARRMRLLWGDGVDVLGKLGSHEWPEVIYLDPMYPERKGRGLAKKEMRVLRRLVGEDTDAPALLAASLRVARARVVVKRPIGAPSLSGPLPSLTINSAATRYDIYLPAQR